MNNDLISRSALKEHKFVGNKYMQIGGRTNGKTIENINQAYQQGWNDAIDAIIDNAPTVEAPENAANCVLTMFGNCSYNKTGCSDCEVKDKIRKALNGIPQGEWIRLGSLGNGNASYECSNCYHNDEQAESQEVPYCWHCGAKMMKEGVKNGTNDNG